MRTLGGMVSAHDDAPVDRVGGEFLRLRPRLVGVGLPLFWIALALGGAPRAQVAAVGGWSLGVLVAFVAEAAYARRRTLTARWLHRSLLATTIAIGVACWLSGGIASPILPLLLAPTALQLVAFGGRREGVLGAGVGVAVVAGLALAPTVFPEVPAPVRRVATCMSTALALALLGAGATKLVTAYRAAVDEVARGRDRELAASRERARSLETTGAQLAHEMKNPLAAARGLAQLLARAPAPERDAERFEVLLAELARLDDLVRDHARFCRPLELARRAPLDLAEIARRASLLVEAKAVARGVAIACHGSAASCHGDEARLLDALVSVIDNAVDASPPGASVDVRASTDGGRARVEVVDRGPALDEATVARIGVPFYTTKPGGNGLGVAIAKNVAEAHGGALAFVRSGAETRATLAIPTEAP